MKKKQPKAEVAEPKETRTMFLTINSRTVSIIAQEHVKNEIKLGCLLPEHRAVAVASFMAGFTVGKIIFSATHEDRDNPDSAFNTITNCIIDTEAVSSKEDAP